MRRLKVAAVISIVAVVALAALLALIMAFPSGRTALATMGLRFIIWQRGYHLASAHLRLGPHRVRIDDLDVTDNRGELFLAVKHVEVDIDPAGLLGRGDRALGLREIVLEDPHVLVIRHDDGSWNFEPLLPRPGAPPAPARGAPLRLRVIVARGEITVLDPQAVVAVGKTFSIDGIDMRLSFDAGHSSGDLSATLRSVRGSAPIRARLFTDDSVGFGRATIDSDDIPLAPVVDALAPATAFIDEGGTASVHMFAYSVGYAAGSPHKWHLSADATVRIARLRLTPLDVPVRDVFCRLHYQDGSISTPLLTGTAAGVPLRARGLIQVLGPMRLAFAASQEGDLKRERALFAFSRRQPVSGPFWAAMRVDGPLSDIRVAGSFRARDAQYAGAALPHVMGTLYYTGWHLTATALDLDYHGARLWAQGDIDLHGSPIDTMVLVQASAPSRLVPYAANVNALGTVRVLATLQGPIGAPEANGYAQLSGGGGSSLQAFFGAGPQRIAYGPALLRSRDGEVFVTATVARRPGRPADIWGWLVASHAGVHVRGGRVALADVSSVSGALPSLDTTVDGAAFVNGQADLPGVGVDARAAHLVVDGVGLGEASLVAGGRNGRVHIVHASLSGGSLAATAHGDLLVTPRLSVSAAALEGSGTADLAAFAPAFPRMHPRGRASGAFSLALSGSEYVLRFQAHSVDASIAGVNVRDGSMLVDSSGATTALLGSVAAPGAVVWAAGSITPAAAGDMSGHLEAFSPHLDLAALDAPSMPLHGGSAVGFATLDGTMSQPRIVAAGTVRSSYDNEPFAGDLDLRYAAATLRSNASRVAFAGNRATISGSVSGLNAGASVRPLALDLSIRDGDLAGLNRFTASRAPLTGSFTANVRVGGNAGAPQLAGNIDAGVGTIRGVVFNELRGRMQARPGAVTLRSASVQVGSSRFALDGDISRAGFAVQAASPHVDMTDFNDFFGGADVFAGTGDFNIDVASEPGELAWGGKLNLDDAAVRDYPLGHIDADFYSRGGTLRAVVRQDGSVGAATVSGTARFTPNRSRLPDLRTATYRLKARLRSVDLAAVLPLFHQEALGVTGRLDAEGQMTGTLHNPIGTATFALHGGRVRRMSIDELSGTLTSDAAGVTLSRGDLTLPYLVATAEGRYTFEHERLDGKAALSAADLAAVATAMRVPGALGGSATADVHLTGSLHEPRAALSIDAGHATIYGIAFDRANINATYAPGSVSIGDTELIFAGNRGHLTLGGQLPLQLQPLALGPKERPVELTMRAQKIDLAVLDPIIGRYVTLTGFLNADASIFGNAGDPVGKGSAQIRSATVTSPLQTVPLTDLNANVSFDRDTITLAGIQARAGRGTIDARGAAHIVPAEGLRANAGLQFSSRVGFHSAQVNVPGWINGTVDGDLAMTRSGVTPYVEGSVTLSNTTIPFSAIYDLATGSAALSAQNAPEEAPGVPKLQPGHTIVYGGGVWGDKVHTLTTIGEPTPAPTGIALPAADVNLALTAGPNVRVRGGNAIDLTTAGGIVIGGNLRAPTLDGQFYAVRGQVGYFDTNFRLVSGTVTFDHESGLLPTMDVIAVTNTGGAEITLHVTGRVDNLNTDLTSNPTMSRDQIIATLLHAPQIASLSRPSSTQAQTTLTQTAQSYFNAQLSRSLLYPVEAALAQQLNIESLSFIFNAQGNLAVEVRTKVTPTISAVYQTTLEVPVTQSYGVSYRLRDYLSLDLVTAQPNLSVTSYATTTLNLQYQFH